MLNKRLIVSGIGIISFQLWGFCSQAQRPQPPAYSGDAKLNFVRTWDAVKPETNSSNITVASEPNEFKMTTQYLEGLGRPVQTVIKKASWPTGGSPADLVNLNTYDEYGREAYQYSTFAANNTGNNASINDGLLKLNPFQQQAVFMNQQYGSQGEAWFYNRTVFEESPLNRVSQNLPVGNSWVGSGRGISKDYSFNSSLETSMRIWTIADAPGSIPVDAGVYGDGELDRVHIFDEHNNLSFEYINKAGQTILKSSLVGPEWLLTYYVYDYKDQLRCVIPPKALPQIWSGWMISQSVMDELCFRYEYDEKGRMIIKKIPGAGEVHMVYDARDRLVLTQDANQRAVGNWMYAQYDDLNRPIATGLWNNSQTRSTHAIAAVNSTGYPNLSGQSFELITETFYDNYDWLNVYTNTFLPDMDVQFNGQLFPASSVYPYPQLPIQSKATTGLVTGTRSKNSGGFYTQSINYYDAQGRVIQTQAHNLTGCRDITTFQYSFSGQLLAKYEYLAKCGSPAKVYGVLTKFELDELGRITATTKDVQSPVGITITGPHAISINSYDELGLLKSKTLAPNFDSDGLETQKFDYNIRGWLLGMNREFLRNSTESGYAGHFFGYELGYDKTTTITGQNFYNAPQYNGNILGTIWKSRGDGVRRKYDFTYDAANRFNWAEFTQNKSEGSGGVFNSLDANFSVHGLTGDYKIKYDLNGNILEMVHRGWKLGTPDAWIDALQYSYYPESNKLKQVTDGSNDEHSKLGDFKYNPSTKTAIDYTYDVNGNLTLDKNKNITLITYNHLNLPRFVHIDGKGYIDYTYDGFGNKMQKYIYETGQPAKTIQYLGSAVYENDVLQFIGMEEGRIRFRPSDNSFQFDYLIKDHLGNVRAVLTEEAHDDPYPVASMETAQATTEEQFYTNVDNGIRSDRPSGYPNDTTYTNPNDKVAKVRGDGRKIGPGITLKVMAGDKFNIRVNSWYKTAGSTPGTPWNSVGDLLFMMNNTAGALTGGKLGLADFENSGVFTPGSTAFLNDKYNGYNTSKPKAFLNWVLFDEQFKYVSDGSGAEQVGNNEEFKTHLHEGMPVTKSGYLYIYVANETPNIDVFFDNLQVTHTRGPILEETHYYPFGLTMAGISSKALSFGEPDNKKGYNGNELQNGEFSNGSGLEFYDFNARSYDPQIGRFMQIDPLTDSSGIDQRNLSPFQFGYNSPTRYNDPTGKCPCLIPLIFAWLTTETIAVTAVAVTTTVVTTAVIQDYKNNKANSNSSDPDQTGSYTNTHESTNKYHGKGTEARAKQSAKEKEVAYDDPVVDTDWQPSANKKEALKDEARRIRKDGGVDNPKNYNIRNSPGERYLQEEEKKKQQLDKIFGLNNGQ